MYEKTLKKILKDINIETWQQELSDEMFVLFLKKYVDNHGNNVYHLLFKNNLPSESLYDAQQIVQILHEYGVPALGTNDKNQFADQLAEKQSILAAKMIREFIQEEYNEELLNDI